MAKRKAISKVVRDRLLVDAMHRCCLCPEHADVTDVHHIVPISEDGPNTADNLMVVCPNCHRKIHSIRSRDNPEQLRMYKERWVRLCALGLPLGVRIAQAYDHTRPSDAAREEGVDEALAPPLGRGRGDSPSPLNPFCDRGRINDPARCFNRKRILRELRQMLGAGNSVSLVGEQEIGKSSVLYCLYQSRAKWLPEAKVLYLDLQGVLDEEDFCAEVMERLGREPGDLRALRRALQQGQTVLLLDEVEKLADPAFSPRLHDLLRAMAQESTLTLAVASHRPLRDVFPPSSPNSPFYNVLTEKRLRPFTPKDARALLLHRLKDTEVTFTPKDMERLVQESGGHPARLQRLAYDRFEQRRR
jgi:hypothetical protein